MCIFLKEICILSLKLVQYNDDDPHEHLREDVVEGDPCSRFDEVVRALEEDVKRPQEHEDVEVDVVDYDLEVH